MRVVDSLYQPVYGNVRIQQSIAVIEVLMKYRDAIHYVLSLIHFVQIDGSSHVD